jgi:uncharacterized cupredoxin-like copper-binding protein
MTATLEQHDAAPAPRARRTVRDEFRGLKSVLVTVGAIIVAVITAIVVAVFLYSPAASTTVTEVDYRIHMPVTLSAGTHRLRLVNAGAQPHELLVFRTPLRANALPVDENGKVIEESPRLQSVLDSGNSLNPHETQPLTVKLTPGHYVAVCNLPAHYGRGMRLDLNVTK